MMIYFILGLLLTSAGVTDTFLHWNRDRELWHIFLSLVVKTVGFVFLVIYISQIVELEVSGW